MRGRRPKNAEVQAARGNPGKRGKRKTVDDVIDAAPLQDGAPSHLSELGRRFWHKVAPEMIRLNFVRTSDRPGLERYCENLAEYWTMHLKLRGQPRTYWTDSAHGKMKRVEPLYLLLQRVEKMLFDYEDRIGLNPAARQRILLGMANRPAGLFDEPAANKSENDGSNSDGKPAGAPDESPIGILAGARVH